MFQHEVVSCTSCASLAHFLACFGMRCAKMLKSSSMLLSEVKPYLSRAALHTQSRNHPPVMDAPRHQSSALRCSSCRRTYNNLASHLRWRPECNQLAQDCDEPMDLIDHQPDELPDIHIRNGWRERIAELLAGFRYDIFMPDSHVARRIKKFVLRVLALLDEDVFTVLAPFMRAEASASAGREALEADHQRVFDGLLSREQELAYQNKTVNYFEPRVVKLDSLKTTPDDQVVSFSVDDILKLMMQGDAQARRYILQSGRPATSTNSKQPSPRCRRWWASGALPSEAHGKGITWRGASRASAL